MVCISAGYALDPSIDNYEVPTKYIGSVEEAEKNQGKLRVMSVHMCACLHSCVYVLESSLYPVLFHKVKCF